MKIVAIIPARGGSKGIERKNIRVIAGLPLIAHSILSAKEVKLIDRVIISTDDSEIAKVARDYSAEVIFRPEELCGDIIMPDFALLHVLDYLKQNENYEPDLVVFLQPTSPLRKPHAIEDAIQTLQRKDADSLFSGCAVHGFVWRTNKDGDVSSFSYDYANRPRRQDAPKDFIENGSIYVFKPWVLRKNNNRLGGKIAMYEMSAVESFQIDEPNDLLLIEHLMSYEQQIKKIHE